MEKTDRLGSTPLLCAARGLVWHDADARPSRDLDQEETIRLLVDAGADLTVSDERDIGWSFPDTPFGHVSSWGGADIVRYLAGKGSDIHQRRSYPTDSLSLSSFGVGGDQVTPLDRAAHNWNAAGVQALLDLGADSDATDGYGRQPLHWAAIGRCLWHDSLKCISPAWSALRAESRGSGLSAKLAALESTISHLVAHNASIGRQDSFGRTPLHYAAYMKLVGAVALLVKQGADPGLPNNEERTAFHHLADPLYHHDPRNHEPVDGDIEDQHLGAALAGRIKGSAHIVDHRDNTGSTALHIAARSASDTAVALLLNLGADPDLPDREGSTPLHLAARHADWLSLHTYEEREYAGWSRRTTRIRELLLGAGADATVRDSQGRTAAEIEEAMSKKRREERVKYLEWLAQPPRTEYLGRGRGWDGGFGRGRRPERGWFPAPPLENDGVQPPSGTGHGRGG
jgi:ankyrin repeat protein